MAGIRMVEMRPLYNRIADDLLQKIRDSVFVDQLPIENIGVSP